MKKFKRVVSAALASCIAMTSAGAANIQTTTQAADMSNMVSVYLKLVPLFMGSLLHISPLGKKATSILSLSMGNGILKKVKEANILIKLLFHLPLFIVLILCDFCIGYILTNSNDPTIPYIVASVILSIIFLAVLSLESAKANDQSKK